MTNYELYEKFEKYKRDNNLTYRSLAKKLKTSPGSLHDKIKRLKNGNSVYTEFLIQLEEILGESIFFR